MMVPAHTHTGPVHGGRSSSRFGPRGVQPIGAPHTNWTERRGPDNYYSDGVSVRGLIGANNTVDPHRWAYTPAWLLVSMWDVYPRMA